MRPVPQHPHSPTRQTGTSLLEVLVSIVIVALGLLGLAGLQAKMQVADLEAYQRTQAIMLMEDMASRVTAYANGKQSTTDYFATALNTKITLGTGGSQPSDCTTLISPTRPKMDDCEWENSLKGAAEVQGTNKLGAMIGARGCLQKIGTILAGNASQIVVTVAWQGMSPTVAPPAAETCGKDSYNANCPSGDDRCRRVVSTIVQTYNPLTF